MFFFLSLGTQSPSVEAFSISFLLTSFTEYHFLLSSPGRPLSPTDSREAQGAGITYSERHVHSVVSKHTVITVDFAPYSSQMRYLAPLLLAASL